MLRSILVLSLFYFLTTVYCDDFAFPSWLEKNDKPESLKICQIFGKVEKLKAHVNPELSNLHSIAHGKEYYYLTLLLLKKNQSGEVVPVAMPAAAYVAKDDYNLSRILGRVRILSNQDSIYFSLPDQIFFACLDLNVFFNIAGFDRSKNLISFFLAISTSETKILRFQQVPLNTIFELTESPTPASKDSSQKITIHDAKNLFVKYQPGLCEKCKVFERTSEKEYSLKQWVQENHSSCVKTYLIGLATEVEQ